MNDKATSPSIYVYRSPFGMLSIRRAAGDRPAWFLVYEARMRASNGELLIEQHGINPGWDSAEAAAQAVLEQQTGWPLWDALPPICFPACLDDWTPADSHGYVQPRNQPGQP
ncbi:hypothetical protein FCJ61_04155 [Burkholderia metallica]|uniref:hypothetical protein n=1 Tax=Burkholderia metallica TaxID=488729 RepID=UPI00157B6B1E|nr:hypothetical protein [Burkholderia metallica]NTZ82231.1 hypothetical protein [Burkholderia metallica]